MNAKRALFPLLTVFVLVACLLASCGHYYLGGRKSAALKDVQTIHVDVFQNKTYYPRAEVLLTSALSQELGSNGTLKLAERSKADAILKGTVSSVKLAQIRSMPYDTYQSLQTDMTLVVDYEVVSTRDGKVLAKSAVQVSSTFFNLGNQQSARWNAYGYAARQAATRLVSQLVY